MNISIRPARVDTDAFGICALLKACDLPGAVDQLLAKAPDNFFVVTVGGKIVGCVGLEVYPPIALVRSLAVDPVERSRGFGANLLIKIIDRAKELGMTEVYGLTTSGQEYMQSHGFTPVDKSKAPPSLLDSAQFKSECPAAAVLLHLTLA